VDAVRAWKPKRLPTVLTKTEALQVLNALVGVPHVMAQLLYGSGVRRRGLLGDVRLSSSPSDFGAPP